jgi:uncharacterized lipoprotein YddW (UPF0748 family)
MMMKAVTALRKGSVRRNIAPGRALLALCLLAAHALTPPTSQAQAAPPGVGAKPARPSHKVWVSLAHSTLDVRPPDWAWLREQCARARVLEALAPAGKRLGGIVVPVFDDGRAFYETKIEPFARRAEDARRDEAALRELLAKARLKGVPVYLGLDVLAWQKTGIEDREGLLASRPEWEEFTTYGESAAPNDARFASPFHRDVRESLRALVEELAARFPDAAGVVLDARFSDQQINGFGRAARAQFARLSGLDPIDFELDNIANLDLNPTLRRWVEWRREAFAEFVGELAETYRRSSRGRVLLSGYAEYYINRDFHDVRTAQDWLGWAAGGRFDGVLLEGRWLNPFPDIDHLPRLRADLVRASREAGKKIPLLAVSAGDQLVRTSDYAKEYRSLASHAADLDGVMLVARGDEDLRRAAAFASGAAPPERLPALAVGAPLPDFTLSRADGVPGDWGSKSLRGKRGLALVLARDGGAEREAASVVGALSRGKEEGAEVVLVTRKPAASASKPAGFVRVADVDRYLLDRVNSDLALVLVDRAGYVRRIEDLRARGRDLTEAFGSALTEVTPALELGRPAPEFTILDSAGREVRLADFRGRRNVLLTFFPKCFTDG